MYKDFFSQGRYINLPIKKKRVSIFVEEISFIDSALKLYQPFSKKAILFKKGFKLLIKTTPWINKLISSKHSKGGFIKHIEQQNKIDLFSSIYYPTILDKLVLQLITYDGDIYGYVKVGLNKKGNAKVINERKAIETLSNKTNLIEENFIINKGEFNEKEYIIIKELKGKSRLLSENELLRLTIQLEQQNTYKLANHPGFLKLLKEVHIVNEIKLESILEKISTTSTSKYKLVFEHGDLAPWNTLEDVNGNIKLFDFEYFSETGIEYMDKFNYYYQIGLLLNKFGGENLIEFLKSKLQVKEFYVLFTVFLISKILKKKKEESEISQELIFLNLIKNEKV